MNKTEGYSKSSIFFSTLFYGTVAQYVATSSDIDTGIQYITPTENHKMIQEVLYSNPSQYYDLEIDSFIVSNTGTAPNSMIASVELWKDGGNGYFDGGGAPPKLDDVKIGLTDFSSPYLIGNNNDVPCLTVSSRSSETVFVAIDIDDTITSNYRTFQTQLDASDLTSMSGSRWSKFEGTDTATSPTYIFSKADLREMSVHDSNENGIIDEIIVNTNYKIGPATNIVHSTNEAATIDDFTLKYDGNEIQLENIYFYDSNDTEASFRLTLDENDPFLSVDTSSSDFTLSYDWANKELYFESADSRSVPIYRILGSSEPIIDDAGPVVTSLTVSDNIITGDDAGDIFEVILSFSEEMNISANPVLDFDDSVHQGSSKTLIFDSKFRVNDHTYQINYTIADEDVYAGDVKVICTTTGTIDSSGVQMSSAYTEENLFTVDTKPPQIFGFPSDTLTPGEDYTIRVNVEDDSLIQSVMLEYNFGSSWNTKPMSYNPGDSEYVAVVTPNIGSTTMAYKISAYDVHDNGYETSEKDLTITDSEEGEDEPGEEEEETEEEPDENDTDGDGYIDEMEESYGTNSTNETDTPTDTDGDGIPDEDSPDGNYTGDADDDNDGIPDSKEDDLGSDSKNGEDVENIENKDGYLVDTNNDGDYDTFYNLDTNVKTNITETEDNGLLVDENGDGNWDYIYYPASGSSENYSSSEEKTDEENVPWPIVIVVVILIAITIIIALFKLGYIKIE